MTHEEDKADLLYGVPAIADFLRMTQPAVYHLSRRADWPGFKIGGKVCARRSAIDQWISDMETKAQEARK
ncbi:DNA-binding protein [Brucella intermedia]|uniref:helix-turn-helix transcriptional regulator n=1 Tax=Brucella intermedia TaxID=94625 RepID=UPI00209AF31B|nr:DNA-binding protein [Brucella intermedia]MCO7736456.1 DNA-binding protein [Brucella intermedia]